MVLMVGQDMDLLSKAEEAKLLWLLERAYGYFRSGVVQMALKGSKDVIKLAETRIYRLMGEFNLKRKLSSSSGSIQRDVLQGL